MQAFQHGYGPAPGSHASRLDLLIRLYDASIAKMHEAVGLIHSGESPGANAALLRATRLVIEIIDGIDPTQGPLPTDVRRLSEFVLDCLRSGDVNRINAAIRVLTTLKEGFAGVRTEVRLLEEAGELPSEYSQSMLDVVT